MPSNCTHDKEAVVLHYYGELDETATAEMEVRLQICPACAEMYAGLVELESVLPRVPSVEPDESVMRAIRAATSRRLMHREGQPSVARRLRVYRPIWARLSIAFATLLLVFIGGRWSAGSGDPAGLPDTMASIYDVSDIFYEPQTGTIRVEYSTIGDSEFQGNLNDPRIRTLITQALMDDDRPATRFRAVSMLNEISVDRIQPDSALMSALAEILREDSNEGVKIQAIKALRRINAGAALDEDMTGLLMEMMGTSENSALRIAALEMLTESELARQVLDQVLQRALIDENGFIRNRARNELEELADPVPLDRIQ